MQTNNSLFEFRTVRDACAWKELINFWSFKGIYNEQLSVHITQVILGQINYSKGDKV